MSAVRCFCTRYVIIIVQTTWVDFLQPDVSQGLPRVVFQVGFPITIMAIKGYIGGGQLRSNITSGNNVIPNQPPRYKQEASIDSQVQSQFTISKLLQIILFSPKKTVQHEVRVPCKEGALSLQAIETEDRQNNLIPVGTTRFTIQACNKVNTIRTRQRDVSPPSPTPQSPFTTHTQRITHPSGFSKPARWSQNTQLIFLYIFQVVMQSFLQ